MCSSIFKCLSPFKMTHFKAFTKNEIRFFPSTFSKICCYVNKMQSISVAIIGLYNNINMLSIKLFKLDYLFQKSSLPNSQQQWSLYVLHFISLEWLLPLAPETKHVWGIMTAAKRERMWWMIRVKAEIGTMRTSLTQVKRLLISHLFQLSLFTRECPCETEMW